VSLLLLLLLVTIHCYVLQRNALDGLHHCIPQGDSWAELLWNLAEQLLAPDPAARPELAAVLPHDFFSAGRVRLLPMTFCSSARNACADT
jgi:hypothetical protein